jgi:hypothetical protein
MRTTLDIEDDVLAAVKDLARRQQRTAGQVLSSLARQAAYSSDREQRFHANVNGARCCRLV